jgi:hypothetical protein
MVWPVFLQCCGAGRLACAQGAALLGHACMYMSVLVQQQQLASTYRVRVLNVY